MSIIRLYHASREEIPVPDIHHGRKNADFGQGFYLTTDREFALRWSMEGYVLNEYELDTSDLNIHHFRRDAEWFDYIFQNRRTKDTLAADVIIGPIANDTIYDTFGIISSGFLEPEDALQLLMIGPEYIQIAIKSEKAVRQLRWIGTEPVSNTRKYRELLKAEEERYQESFAKTMEKI